MIKALELTLDLLIAIRKEGIPEAIKITDSLHKLMDTYKRSC